MARHVNPGIRQRSFWNPSTRRGSGSLIAGSSARAALVGVATLGCAVAGSMGIGIGVSIAMSIAMSSPAWAQGDVGAGQKIFSTECAVCHSNVPGGSGYGPTLAGVVGRKAGSLPGFDYSSALKSSGLVWNDATLSQFLTGPSQLVPGTTMQATVPSMADRTNLIAYLATLKGAPAGAASAAAVPPVVGPSQAQLDAAASDSEDWLYATHDYAGTRFVDLKQITPANAATLRPVCLYRADQEAPTQTDPIVYKGVMYLTFGATTVAIDATTCRQIWANTWPLQGHIISPTNRGVAIKDGKLVRGVADGHLIALDLASGSLLWSRQIASATDGQYMSMPPLISADMVIYGPAGADFGAQNWIGAFKLDNGDPLWRFYLVPNPGQPGSASWKNQAALKHGGGSLWTPLSLDAKAGILYVPVGNPAPDFYGAVRPGADLYTDSVVALDLRTGRLLWYRQFVMHDVHDTDLSQVSPLFDLNVGGADRQLMAVSGKDGLLRVVDRRTHDILYQVPITTRENADSEPTVEGTHRCPGLLGGNEWNGPAFDPVSKQLFVNAVDWCGTFKKFPDPPPYTAEQHYYGGSVTPDPRDQAKGWLTAFDAATGKVNWKYQAPKPLIAGIVATSGGVLFTGDLDGNFLAMNAANGEVLYRFNTGGSVGGGTVSYQQNAKQYVAITSGAVSAFFAGNGPPAVVVFALP
jgi:PQQ-dependent dehydrogenase (methanol/ethanol family)